MGIKKTLGLNKSFDFLIFFVTARCNSRCRTCFYWRELNSARDLPLEKIARIAATMPRFTVLLLSGGEPFLRDDLAEVIELFVQHNGVRSVNIPTNGLLPERVEEVLTRLLPRYSEVNFVVNFSLDGTPQTHDYIRGVPDGYDKTTATIRRIFALRDKFANLELVVNTVICADNYEEIVPFTRHLAREFELDGHFFEIVRGEPRVEGMTAVPAAVLRGIYETVLPLQEEYFIRRLQRVRAPRRWWRVISRVGNLVLHYRTQWRNYAHNQPWLAPCLAGETIGVLEYDARLGVCELRAERVQLADYDYDWRVAWDSEVMQRERATAKTHQCDCTHICFVDSTYAHHVHTRFLYALLAYLRYKIMGRL